MTAKPLRYIAASFLSGAILTLLVGATSVWFLRNLGEIIGSLAPALGLNAGTAHTLSEIFGQLRFAWLKLPLGITGAMCFLFCGFAVLFLSGKQPPKTTEEENSRPKIKRAARIVTVFALGVIIFLLSTALTIWFTEVNSIRFDRVMTRLVSLLNAGIL